MAAISFERAVEVFVRGFCFTRSYTSPYRAERVDGAWVMRDAPEKKRDRRVEEFVGYGLSPIEWAGIARKNAHSEVFRICAMLLPDEDDSVLRNGFRDLQYRLMVTEDFFAHNLESIANIESEYAVTRVSSSEEAQQLAKTARRRQILPKHIEANPAPVRQYVAKDGEKVIGWAQSIVLEDACWCSNVFVKPEYRRKGAARAMLSRLLVDDRQSGAVASVLLASHAGSKLYPTMGYEKIGRLYMFTPPRRICESTRNLRSGDPI